MNWKYESVGVGYHSDQSAAWGSIRGKGLKTFFTIFCALKGSYQTEQLRIAKSVKIKKIKKGRWGKVRLSFASSSLGQAEECGFPQTLVLCLGVSHSFPKTSHMWDEYSHNHWQLNIPVGRNKSMEMQAACAWYWSAKAEVLSTGVYMPDTYTLNVSFALNADKVRIYFTQLENVNG